MSNDRAERLGDMLSRLSEADRTSLQRCAERLLAALPKPHLPDNVVLVAFGGGKDSSYSVFFVRAMQLWLWRQHGATFALRVVTNRQAGMPAAVMANIDRVYQALGLHDDPDCQLLLVDADDIRGFTADAPHSAAMLDRNRLDVLLTGHRTAADARPTFCNACNLSMVNAFGLAAGHDGGVDVIITGDSRQEQRAYAVWVNRLARRFGGARRGGGGTGFGGFLTSLDAVSQVYFAEIHGPGPAVEERRITSAVPPALLFFSIYDETEYASGSHWQLLTEFLGFRFDELAFSFTESDCANPALMAHLRGLKAERMFGRDYAEGLAEYAEFAVGLMRRKEFPDLLVDMMTERYHGDGAAARLRRRINEFAWESYRLREEQLVCMVYAPFAGCGAGLDRFVTREHPAFAGRLARLHEVLAGTGDGTAADRDFLTEVSGLPLDRLRLLYHGPAPAAGDTGGSILAAVLDGDPHKAVITTRHASAGPQLTELISGR
ncbi:hypothetical protein ACTOB_006551 [Actinoplanes oblitus]|uniref:PqqD family protein n=1 Tax=Actinoplanes oblitus TaxID=3040509 RepID=A0ABY8W9G9_9ACTN|nr:hypothetical protein [Actinoplanes oblitus]WIM94524.1 hypothetical protein ACTOB_006551 [Actinoplanes oblitus]